LPQYKNKRTIPINYTSRDFETIKRDLVEHAKRYYPDNFKDFSENSFGSLMVDTVAYVGDILSFYLDYAVNESYLSTSIEYDNIVKLSRQMGYKYKRNASSTGVLSFYILVPASADGVEPDYRYAPLLKKGSTFNSSAGTEYTLTHDVDFASDLNEAVVASQNSTNSNPAFYAIKAFGNVTSGQKVTLTHTVGDFQRFLRIDINDDAITNIVDVVDQQGNRYYEVDHLSQNIVYQNIVNKAEDKKFVSNIMKPLAVPRRFMVEQNRTTTSLQFGFGSESNLSNAKISDPSNVVLSLHGKDYVTDRTFDPTNLIETDKLGVVPSNTVLTISYIRNSSDSLNAAVNTVENVSNAEFLFENIGDLDPNTVQTAKNSLECLNEEPITGFVSVPSSEELKHRAYGSYSSQNRAVTLQDYQSLIYNIPPQFGAVKRANIVRDANSAKRNLNIFVLSEDHNGDLMPPTSTLKNNIKTWLSNYKMINDTMDILNGKVVNIGIEFVAVSDVHTNKFDLLNLAKINLINDLADIKYDLGEPFRISDVFRSLKNTEGILDVTKVKIFKRKGNIYSSFFYNIEENTTSDNRLIRIPEYAAFEIRYPNSDIVGTII
jgi:antitoxin component HigA of HigAB toxin-antitoxin module